MSMKQFLKMTMATILGALVVFVLSIIVLTSVVGSMLTIGTETPSMPKDGILTIDMSSFMLAEQDKKPELTTLLQGNEPIPSIGIWNAVQSIKTAAQDPSIRYIFIRPDNPITGLAQIEEFRNALEIFRKSGKPVIAYLENPSNGSYYLASVADKIYMTSHQGGLITMNGLATQLVFLKDALDKLGVNVQLIRHGKYKSAGEMYIKNASSPENREQNQEMIDAIWEAWTAKICASRDIAPEKFNGLIDELELNSPEDFLENKLVDELMSHDELKNKLADLAQKDSYRKVGRINFTDYVTLHSMPNFKASNKIAIIYADGSIVDGDQSQEVAGARFANIITKVRLDDNVKAVVLRVNSPGGSVFASEQIKSELDLLRETKPVIASYGNYAASGGYWISSNCDYIFSDEGTLTGSIGVFSMIPDISGTLKKIAHVNVETISSNKHGDLYGMTRALTPKECEYLQEGVEDIYNKFTSIVSKGRNMTVSQVDDIAQGRVWAGTDAKNIGLVDQLGGLDDAVAYAIAAAGEYSSDLSEWQIENFPKPISMSQELMLMLSGAPTQDPDGIFAGTFLSPVATAYADWSAKQSGKMYAAMPYIYDIK